MKAIGTGAIIKLSTLIKSAEINDKSQIAIYDRSGKYLARGAWYEDKILEFTECFGLAYKTGTGRSVTFKLCN